MGFSCLELLPQSPKTQLPTHLTFSKTLKMLEFTTFHTIEALENFYVKKNYHEFDPHVGDTACQLHAYKIFLLSLEPMTNNLKNKISQLKSINEKIKSDLICYTKIENTSKARHVPHTTLEEFINNQDYDYKLEDDEIFIVISRILTTYKKFISDRKFIIDYEKISRDLNISREGATKLAIFYQRKISQRSCNLILNIATQVSYPFIDQEVLKNLIVKDDNAREVLPCFLGMKIILAHMGFLKIGLVLVVNRKLKNKIIDKIYIPYSPTRILKNQPCYIIEGTSNVDVHPYETKEMFIHRFSQLNPEEIILLNEAAHPQFSGKTLESFRVNPFDSLPKTVPKNLYQALEKELLSLREEALIRGCSHENSAFFHIEHIFCGRIANVFNVISGEPLKTEQQEDLFLMD